MGKAVFTVRINADEDNAESYPQQRTGAEIRAAMPDPEEFGREVAEARKANAARRQKAHRDSVKEL